MNLSPILTPNGMTLKSYSSIISLVKSHALSSVIAIFIVLSNQFICNVRLLVVSTTSIAKSIGYFNLLLGLAFIHLKNCL